MRMCLCVYVYWEEGGGGGGGKAIISIKPCMDKILVALASLQGRDVGLSTFKGRPHLGSSDPNPNQTSSVTSQFSFQRLDLALLTLPSFLSLPKPHLPLSVFSYSFIIYL